MGKVPCPGKGVDQLIRELQGGYRMEKPQFATKEIGHLVADRWKAEPDERPTFYQLQEALGNRLEATVSEDYLSI